MGTRTCGIAVDRGLRAAAIGVALNDEPSRIESRHGTAKPQAHYAPAGGSMVRA